MNTHTAVEVFLGKHIDVPSEQQFLARLQRDLQKLKVSARILANLQVGRLGDRQVDFVIVTNWRTAVIELKTYAGPIISGPRNGPWTFQVGAGTIKERRNPLEQVRSASQYFSDELHVFADHANAPGPRKTIGPMGPKFYTDLDAVACVFPTVPSGSTWEEIRHTELVGYDALLDRLQRPGPTLQWSAEHWDKFVRHLNLYRADEDALGSIVRRTGAAVIDAYAGLYREAHVGTAPIATTAVMVEGTPAARPDVTKMLSGGATVLLRGSSGVGKSLWARTIAVELAAFGHLPIWIDADMCDGPFLTACAQAIAPYTALNVNELLKAADAAGRAVVFVVDDFSKITGQSRRRLLDGLRTARVRATGRGLLITDQRADHGSHLGALTDIELLEPDDDDRRGVLAAYGRAELIDRCEAFATPLELSVAAQCADDLGAELSHAELFDTYVDKLVAGDPQTRSGLRSIAARMTADLRPFQRRGDAARRLRRDLGMSDERVQSVFECDLLVDARGRISFRHEQFERFLAAESMLLSEIDSVMLSRQLNSPSLAGLRRDVIALETDRDRLETLLLLCEDADVLVDAANGQLGVAAAGVVAGG